MNMDESLIEIVEECSAGSEAGRLRFPDVVHRLMAAEVEQYHADLLRSEKTYYMPDGSSHRTTAEPVGAPIAAAFITAGVGQAVRAAQAAEIDYREFCRRIAHAGCTSYIVSLAGRRVVYLGRTGESHVEHFPQQA